MLTNAEQSGPLIQCIPNGQPVIDVPATGKGTELVPGRVSHYSRWCGGCRQLVEFGGFPGGNPIRRRVVAGGAAAKGASSLSAGRHVNLVQTLVDGEERCLQLVFGVLGVRALGELVVLVVVVGVVVVSCVAPATRAEGAVALRVAG